MGLHRQALFLQFESVAQASSYCDEVRALFDRHAAFVRELGREGHSAWSKENPRGLTPPMVDFASRAGLEWSSDDALIWEDDYDDPWLDIASLGRLAVVSHGASRSIGEDGLRALAKLRGATAIAFWDPDPVPMSVRVTLLSDEAEQALLAAVDEVDVVDDDDEVLTDSPPDDADVRAVFIRGSRHHYLAFPDALEDLLSALQSHEVEVELTVEEQPDIWRDVAQVLAIVGHLYRAARRLGGPDPSGMLKFARAMSGREITVTELEGAAPETLTPEQLLELRSQAVDFDPIGWKLAAVSPETAETLRTVISAHEDWASRCEETPQWSTIQLAYADGVQTAFDGAAMGQALLDHRDLRRLSFAGRNLSYVNLVESLVDESDFSGATLRHVQATDLHALRARLDGANLDGADLSRSKLKGSSFRNASCIGTKFEDCDLEGCDFRGATASDPRVKALIPPPVRHPKLGRGHAMEMLDDKVRVLFEDGVEKIIKRSFLQWD